MIKGVHGSVSPLTLPVSPELHTCHAVANPKFISTWRGRIHFVLFNSQVKMWAKRRQIGDPYRGFLSSYTYVLLIIQVICLSSLLPNPS